MALYSFSNGKSTMKPLNKDVNQLKAILTDKLKVHKNNCGTVVDFLLSMQKAHTINLSQMSNYSSKVGIIKQDSIYKSYQRLMQNSQIAQRDIANCIINMFGLDTSNLILSMDRTNWQYGNKDINLLVLSVCVEGTAIPLYWLELSSRGNSNTDERIQLLDLFIEDFGADKISYVLADREFVGNDWFDYLCQKNVQFIVRIKCNMHLETGRCSIKAGRLFGGASKYCLSSKIVEINGKKLLAQATRSDNNELVIVISNDTVASDLLVLYAIRWNIECLFGQLKTRGFNFEDTRITLPHRIGNLMKLIVLSFAVCYLVGLASTA